MSTITTSTFDVAALRDAYANRDAERLIALYAPTATVEIVDAQNQPSKPRRLSGRDEIATHVRDVFSRDMTHEIGTSAVGDDALGFHLRCTYAEGGARVLCSSTAELQ